MHDAKQKGNPLHIRHALNGGEVKIPGTNYRVDGYAEIVSESNGQSSPLTIMAIFGTLVPFVSVLKDVKLRYQGPDSP